MALFKRKKTLSVDEQRQQALMERHQAMLGRLRQALEQEPGFQLCTFDGLNWIDPFTGQLVAAPFDFKRAAMDHFAQHHNTRGHKPKPLIELRAVQWQHYLEDHYDADRRFHFFSKEGNWINPFNGRGSAAIIRQGPNVTPELLKGMARTLAAFDQADPEHLLSMNQLRERYPSLDPDKEDGGMVVTDTMISADEMGKLDNWDDIGQGDTVFDGAKAEEAHVETRAYERPMAPPPPIVGSNDERSKSTEPIAAYQASISRSERDRNDDHDRRRRGDDSERTERRRDDDSPRPRSRRRQEDSDRHERSRHDDTDVPRHRPPPATDALARRRAREDSDRRDRKEDRPRSGPDRHPDPETTIGTGKPEPTTRAENKTRTTFHELYAPPEKMANEDLKQARIVQDNLMGKLPKLVGIEFGLHYEPYQYIGGDFYDFIQLDDNHLVFLLGDVSGHGTQAALVVGSILKSLHFLLNQASAFDLTEILCRLNDDVRGDLIPGQFFTAFIGLLQTGEQRKMQCICAGHHASICINPNGPNFMRRVGKNGMALGVATDSILRKQLRISTEHFIPGDTLCVYTDGVHEAMSKDGQEFGHWRARASFLSHIQEDVETLGRNVTNDVKKFANGQPQDDITILSIRFT